MMRLCIGFILSLKINFLFFFLSSFQFDLLYIIFCTHPLGLVLGERETTHTRIVLGLGHFHFSYHTEVFKNKKNYNTFSPSFL